MAATRTRKRPARRKPVRRPSVLTRAARATITPYDRRAAALLSGQVHRALADTRKTLGITPAGARALGYLAFGVLVLVALLLTVAV